MGERKQAKAVVLCPVDFEAASRAAVGLAKEIAGCFDAEVVLLHAYAVLVQPYPGLTPAEVPMLPGIHLEVAAAAKRALDELSAEHGGLRSILVEGEPAAAILDEAQRLHPKMIVMGTHGRSGLKHLILGSVAEKV